MASNSDIPVLGPILSKLFGSRNDRFVKRYTQRVEEIGALEDEMRAMTDAQLRERLVELRGQHDDGAKTEDLLVPTFATAREAMDRHVGIRSIFNPDRAFDAGRLNQSARKLFDQTAEAIAAFDLSVEDERFLGNPEPVAAWRRVDIPAALYEAVRELYPESRPPFRARPFDVQLIGAMVLSQGKIAEMKTGEGKTIVAPLAAILASVQRMQVHVVTVNDYLVQRDRDWTAPFFEGLGLSVGAIHPSHQQPEDMKRRMYRCDVVYGTTSEFGFDYLRDNMKRSVEQQVQRKRQFAIVDEVDSVLIDEARTPLIISGAAHDDQPRYELADGLARQIVDKQRPWQNAEDEVTRCKETIKGLEGDIRQARDKSETPTLQSKLNDAKSRLPGLERQRDTHTQYFELKPERKSAHLTHDGIAEAQRLAGVGSFYVDDNQDIPHLLEQAVRAHAIYERDKDYIVMNVPDRMSGKADPSIVIVDQNTGRPMIGRQWSDGLHQAIECKERVPIKQETQTVATVTVQNFFKMYKRLSGMTGTADTEAQEFNDIYGLDVVSIPTNLPMVRDDRDDLMFLRMKDKWEAIVDEVKAFHDVGRPVLVGTTSVEKSEMLSQMLSRKHQVEHSVLNAKQHEKEANVVEDAGQLGAVMIATNMAGRGTDIRLGTSSREELLTHWLKRGLASRKLTVDASDEALREDVFRKIAPQHIEGMKKREAEEMDFEELELQLLRHWAEHYTLESEKAIGSMDRDSLMSMLDATGRFLLHRIRWFSNVEDMGGLHVIGTERHESRRIDNQLRGRAGRQGDNGSSRFYVSLEDDLMKMFAGETTQRLLARMGMKEGDAIEHPWLSKNVERAQRKVEERNFQIRKNILEYDEVMEHQRQRFYGLRQRVLEGRDVKGLIFDYIEDAVGDAVGEMLDPEFPAQRAAEYAKEALDCSIEPEKLRGKELNEMEAAIRKLARADVAHMINVTLGEYMPVEGSEVSVDFDSAGLVRWAKNRFGIEIDAGELREGGAAERRAVQTRLEEAAFESIENSDLSGLEKFVVKNYGAHELAAWCERKFGFTVDVDEIVRAKASEERWPGDPILEKARELYRRREIEYPVDFTLETVMMIVRQAPDQAFGQLQQWASRRHNEQIDLDEIKRTPPQRIRERFVAMQERFVDDDAISKSIDDALAFDDDKALDAHLTERFGVGLTDRMRYLEGTEREDAIRARVENILRPELLFFERSILLDLLDQSWKDHLYAMDQLRDTIGFRAFSQQDPRIQYKREGSELFNGMLDSVRDRLTDLIFKARISPQAAMQQMRQDGRLPTRRPAAPQGVGPARAPGGGAMLGGVAAGGGGSIMGPGLPMGAAARPTPEAPTRTNGEEASESPSATEQMEAAKAAKAADRGKERTR